MFTISRLLLSLWLLVACVAPLSADELLVAPDDAPQYELTGIQRENDRFGSTVLVIDYKLVRKETRPIGSIRIAGKTKNGELIGFSVQRLEDSGQLRVGLGGMLWGENDYEIYLVIDAGWKKKYMVSNAVRLGDPGPATTARGWTDEEVKAAERAKLAPTPPAELPAGFLPVTAETILVPGMPIKAGSFAEWVDAQVIRAEGTGTVDVKFPSDERLQPMPREKWLAVDPDVLARAKSDPSQFEVSIRLLPDSLLAIPDGAIPLAGDVELPPGSPLILDDDHSWKNIFVVEADAESIKVRYEGFEANWDKSKPRNKFVIKEATLALLSRPEEVKKFVENLVSPHTRRMAEFESARKEQEATFRKHQEQVEEAIAGARARAGIHHQSYPIDLPLPKRAQVLPADLELEAGTPLAVCWARKWQPLTVLHENQDGSVHVHWDGMSSGFNCSITRDQLIIEDKTVRKLRRKSSAPKLDAATPDNLTSVLRTWTDVTGKHKIEAFFVRKTDTEVTLKTDAGRELTLSIEKLSEQDRALISEPTGDDDNPFE
jgi:hypothetical protein